MTPRRGRWDRLIGRLFPAWFVRDFGGPVADMAREEEDRARAAGPWALARSRLDLAADLARGSVEAWRARPSGWPHDVHLAIRSLRRSPSFVLAGVATLGLGAAVSAGMFNVIDQVLVRPLPVERPDRLLHVRLHLPPEPQAYSLSPADLTALADAPSIDRTTSPSSMPASYRGVPNATAMRRPERLTPTIRPPATSSTAAVPIHPRSTATGRTTKPAGASNLLKSGISRPSI